MATVKAVIRKKPKTGEYILNKDGKAIVMIVYGHKSLSAYFSTGIKVTPRQFDEDRQIIDMTKGVKINSSTQELLKLLQKESSTCNILIESTKSKISTIARDLLFNDIDPMPQRVKSEYENKYKKPHQGVSKEKGFTKLVEEYIESQKSLKSEGTIRIYETILRNIVAFEKSQKCLITFDNINEVLYEKMVKYFMNDHELRDGTVGMKTNSIGNQIKSFKVFAKELLRAKKLPCDLSRFKAITEETEIIFLTFDELEALYKHKFTDSQLAFYRDIYLLQCYLSLRISDIQRLGPQHIQNDIVHMRAHKTKRNITVNLHPVAKEILERYNYNIPKFREENYNAQIKVACKEAGINSSIELQETIGGRKVYNVYSKYELITSHTAVKTFISLMLQRGMQVKEVAAMSGKSINVISKYYHGLDDTVVLEKAKEALNWK